MALSWLMYVVIEFHRALPCAIVYALSGLLSGGNEWFFFSPLTSHLSPLKINSECERHTTRLAHRLIVVGVVGVFIQQVIETVVVAQVEDHIADADTCRT